MLFPSPDHIARILSALSRRDLSTPKYEKAAVLIPLIARKEPGDYDLLLTLRTESVEHHKGQVSFPGGTTNNNDRDEIATALREAEEEVGIASSEIQILGTLNNVWTPSGFIITPIVGYLTHFPHLVLQHGEVAEAFCVPLSFFSDPANMTTETRYYEGQPREVYFYHYGNFTIWGITAIIIRELVQVLVSGIRTL